MLSKEYASKLHIRRNFLQKLSFTFHAYRNFLIVSLFFLITLLALALSYGEQNWIKKTRTFLWDHLNPIEQILLLPVTWVEHVKDGVRDWGLTYGQLKLLEKENAALKQRIFSLEVFLKDQKNLKTLLNLKDRPYRQILTARVLTYPNIPFSKGMMITAGSNEGLLKQHPVVTEKGLVGRTMEIGENTTHVLLISDLNSKIPVVIQSRQEHAILAGDNNSTPVLKYFLKDTKIQPGDVVETSGIGGVFPVGIPVGVVREVTEDKIKVQPYADLDGLRFVMIIEDISQRDA